MQILNKIDPEQKYFTNLDETVVAPQDRDEQGRLVRLRKSFEHFKKKKSEVSEIEYRPDLPRSV